MNSDWVFAMDLASANGLLDYDAPADILGVPPRYVGRANLQTLSPINPEYLPQTQIKQQPNFDKFEFKDNIINDRDDMVLNNPSWKRKLFYGLAGVGIGTGLVALVSKILKRKP